MPRQLRRQGSPIELPEPAESSAAVPCGSHQAKAAGQEQQAGLWRSVPEGGDPAHADQPCGGAASAAQERQAQPQQVCSLSYARLLKLVVLKLVVQYMLSLSDLGLACRLSEIPTKSEIMLVRTDGKSCSRELVEGASALRLGLTVQALRADFVSTLQPRGASALHTPAASSSCWSGRSDQRRAPPAWMQLSTLLQLACKQLHGSHHSWARV